MNAVKLFLASAAIATLSSGQPTPMPASSMPLAPDGAKPTAEKITSALFLEDETTDGALKPYLPKLGAELASALNKNGIYAVRPEDHFAEKEPVEGQAERLYRIQKARDIGATCYMTATAVDFDKVEIANGVFELSLGLSVNTYGAARGDGVYGDTVTVRSRATAKMLERSGEAPVNALLKEAAGKMALSFAAGMRDNVQKGKPASFRIDCNVPAIVLVDGAARGALGEDGRYTVETGPHTIEVVDNPDWPYYRPFKTRVFVEDGARFNITLYLNDKGVAKFKEINDRIIAHRKEIDNLLAWEANQKMDMTERERKLEDEEFYRGANREERADELASRKTDRELALADRKTDREFELEERRYDLDAKKQDREQDRADKRADRELERADRKANLAMDREERADEIAGKKADREQERADKKADRELDRTERMDELAGKKADRELDRAERAGDIAFRKDVQKVDVLSRRNKVTETWVAFTNSIALNTLKTEADVRNGNKIVASSLMNAEKLVAASIDDQSAERGQTGRRIETGHAEEMARISGGHEENIHAVDADVDKTKATLAASVEKAKSADAAGVEKAKSADAAGVEKAKSADAASVEKAKSAAVADVEKAKATGEADMRKAEMTHEENMRAINAEVEKNRDTRTAEVGVAEAQAKGEVGKAEVQLRIDEGEHEFLKPVVEGAGTQLRNSWTRLEETSRRLAVSTKSEGDGIATVDYDPETETKINLEQ